MNLLRAFRDGIGYALDAVFPPRAREMRTRSRALADIPLTLETHDLLRMRVTTLMEYKRPEVQDLIRALKYDGSRHAAALAADVLADYLREELASVRSFSPRRILLVPVPLHRERQRERGFNQIELVLRALPEEMRAGHLAHVEPHALVRSRATPKQTHLSRQERLSNVAGAFEVRDAGAIRGTHVYLLDDVTTTGATLVHAAAPLRHAGAKVTLLALARA